MSNSMDADLLSSSSSSSLMVDEPFDLTLFYVVTLYSFYSVMIPRIVALAVYILIWDSPVEKSLNRQITDLKKELRSLSITDEFAKYSKIQRKLNKAQVDMNAIDMSRMIHSGKITLVMYIILYSISAVTTILLHWNYYYQPVLILPDNSLYPFGWLVGFPTGHTNCFSVLTWSFITGYIFKAIFK